MKVDIRKVDNEVLFEGNWRISIEYILEFEWII